MKIPDFNPREYSKEMLGYLNMQASENLLKKTF
jgi:hypothetical protein